MKPFPTCLIPTYKVLLYFLINVNIQALCKCGVVHVYNPVHCLKKVLGVKNSNSCIGSETTAHSQSIQEEHVLQLHECIQ